MNMKNLKHFACGAALILTSLYADFALAESFKNSDFLKLDNEQKKYWLTGAIGALFHVAAAKSKEQGRCVYQWYYTDTPKKVGLIIASMEKYPTSTPSAILLALSERSCGIYRK